MATSTPWGPSQSSHPYGRGIVFYTTAGHGGFHVSKSLYAKMPKHLTLETPGPLDAGKYAPPTWFEEDCEWALVVLAFPERFDDKMKADAERTVRSTYPNVWETHYGRTLGVGESRAKDVAQWQADHANELITIAAWGDWHKDVPAGMVGVVATLGGQRGDGHSHPTEHYFLVPQAEYDARGPFGGFVIDQSRHQPTGTIR